jgi:DNA modification methylase
VWPDGKKSVLGLEKTFTEYLDHLLFVMDECKRVLKKSGTMWVNIGDSYGGSWGNTSKENDRDYPGDNPPQRNVMAKSLLAIPARFQVAMIDRGWVCRNVIIWAKQVLFPDGLTIGSVMPSSVKDRFNQTWENLFFFTKSPKYYFSLDSVRVKHVADHLAGNKDLELSASFDGHVKKRPDISYMPDYQGKFSGFEEKGSPGARTQRKKELKEHFNKSGSGGHFDYGGIESPEASHNHPEGKNCGSCWQINPEPLDLPHFAAYPTDLCRRPILAGCPEKIYKCEECGNEWT